MTESIINFAIINTIVNVFALAKATHNVSGHNAKFSAIHTNSCNIILDAYNDGYLSHFVHSDNQFVFTMSIEYIIIERSRRAVLRSLDYDVNIEK